MSTSIDSQLNESLRDALVALFLHVVVPNDETIKALKLDDKIKTANDIYEYLLLDVLVSQNVPTSPVACALASLQQYVNGILMNMEPGYEQASLTPEQIKSWRNEMHQYPLWAANQALRHFPALYLAPALRLNKTDNFRQLENDINQNQIQPETVQTAVLAYLARFEEIANLNVLNGYINGEDFANSLYYFIGKSRAENAYYWRSLDMRQRQPIDPHHHPDEVPPPSKHDTPEPDAWSDWKRANLPISDNAVEHSIRPVWFNNRLFVVWAEIIYQDPSAVNPATGSEAETTSKTNPQLRLNVSYKKYDDSWSAPQTYLQGYGTDTKLHENPHLLNQIVNTIAVYDHSTSPETLFIALYVGYKEGSLVDGTNDEYTFLKTARIDKNFNVTPMFPSNEKVPNKTQKPALPISKNNDTETEKHVLTVGRLFASTQWNLDRFQFWLPSFVTVFTDVKNTSEHTGTDDWDYKGLQKNIADLSKNIDVTYDRKTANLQFKSKIIDTIDGNATVSILFNDASNNSLLRLTLVFYPAPPTHGRTVLLAGSILEPVGTSFFLHPSQEYHFQFQIPNPGGDPTISDLYALITDQDKLDDAKYIWTTLNSTPEGEKLSLEGKFIKNTALPYLLSHSTQEYTGFVVSNSTGSPTLEAGKTSTTATKPLVLQHIILHPKESTQATPQQYDDMIVLATSPPQSRLLAGEGLSLSIPIDQNTMHPHWPGDWPDNPSSIPFIHGVAISEAPNSGETQGAFIGFAFKAVSVIWGEKNDAADQISPIIWHQESPSLGNAESIDFVGTAIHHSDGSKTAERPPIRMNTTFARHLMNLAEAGLGELLTWGTQQLTEPPTFIDTHAEPMDFNGAYGLYFRELFLYLPWLVADRLNQEQQFREAERWLEYVFDTNRKKDSSGRPDYWNAVALDDSKAPPAPTWPAPWPNDPDFIARSSPVHFRKALYLLYLDVLVNRGDAAYRQLTPDGLAEAKLWYVRVLDLLGPRPDVQTVDSWAPITLKNLNAANSPHLRAFEQRLIEQDRRRLESHARNNRAFGQPGTVSRLSVSADASQTLVSTIDNPYFRLPFNRELVKYWDLCDSRLYNLRSNLDITGKPLHLPLFAPPLDPRALLAAWGQGVSGDGLDRLLTPDIPPYRFSVMYIHAMNAVDSVIQFGATLLSLIERKEQAQHLELQQQQAWDMAKIAVDLQTQALMIEGKNREALLASQRVVKGRVDFYAKLLVEGINEEERGASQNYLDSQVAEDSASTAQTIAAYAMCAPNIFGLADGGQRLEGVPFAAQSDSQGLATSQRSAALALDRTAQFNRRAQEWEQALDQAENEYAQLDAQLAVQAEQEKASRLQLRQAETALAQTKATYDLLTNSNRFTKTQTYEWLNSQFATFYYQAYDATQSLCRAVEACWRYERADYSSPSFIKPGAWNATWRGLGAGESLKTSLLQMHSKYLLEDERELEIRKTVSLSKLLGAGWSAALSDLKSNGSIAFKLQKDTFKDDYNSLYLRRIKSVSVSLPIVAGPYEDIHGSLTQINNTIELYDKSELKDRRANQQVALSTGVDDSGLFNLSFQDERYLPFEFTGLISEWTLELANTTPEQKAMLESITDIIVHILYTARK
ncbi:neuraminidase-like domain-containing protein [Pseudomonas fluorescens]|uniref:Toxin n=1 Tax=Pseudomonas fluorescens TaxID=294 RepID=A0A5E7FVX1_PSEFL|nr:neuraminidase-like domain-containing protein [Pseudomonas fluorescens]VVO43519.1 hypothetical protein PS723_06194 [Pseudomonas fluorescens]